MIKNKFYNKQYKGKGLNYTQVTDKVYRPYISVIIDLCKYEYAKQLWI